jgi:heat-inducible transcriptional repressor
VLAEHLSPRQAELLRAVCREYLLVGDEVASAALARSCDWSSATIRNELVALERAGLVDRAHRSAGCRPTRAGLEHYVREQPHRDEPPPELARVVERSLASSSARPEHGVRAAVCVLAELAGCVAISFVADPTRKPVVGLELVPLSSARALAVVAFDDGGSTVQPIDVGGFASVRALADELLPVQTRLRELCIGRTLHEAHAELLRLQRELQSHVDSRLAEVVRLGLSLVGGGLDPLWLSVAGQSNLTHGLGGLGLDGLREVLGRLEDDRRLADILWQLLPPAPSAERPRAQVVLGGSTLLDGEARSGTDDAPLRLALVGCRLPTTPSPAGPDAPAMSVRIGAVAVIGPDRLDYASLIPLVEYAARALAART